MPETILLLAALLGAGAIVLWPLRSSSTAIVQDEGRDAAAVRHRVALEALRDVELDRRAGSLDEGGYAQQLTDAETRAAATAAELSAGPSDGEAAPPPSGVRAAAVIAAVVGSVVIVGSLFPATGIANSTDVNEALAAAEAAETSRQTRIDTLLDELSSDPENTETLSDLADAYLAGSTTDDLARAAAALQVLIALQPDRADAYERVIGAYLRAGDVANARRALDSYAAREAAEPVEVAFFGGIIALREGDPEAAVAAFDRFLELAPDDPRASMVRGLREEAAAGS